MEECTHDCSTCGLDCASRSAGAPQKEKTSILSLADRPEIIKRKKKPPQKSNLYYSSRGSGRNN